MDFTVIERVEDANGKCIDSYSIAEFATEDQANAYIELQFANLLHIPDEGGDYLHWFVNCA